MASVKHRVWRKRSILEIIGFGKTQGFKTLTRVMRLRHVDHLTNTMYVFLIISAGVGRLLISCYAKADMVVWARLLLAAVTFPSPSCPRAHIIEMVVVVLSAQRASAAFTGNCRRRYASHRPAIEMKSALGQRWKTHGLHARATRVQYVLATPAGVKPASYRH